MLILMIMVLTMMPVLTVGCCGQFQYSVLGLNFENVVVDFDGVVDNDDDDDAGFNCWLLWAVLVFRGQAGL